MTKGFWKVLAIILSIVFLGTLSETKRILTSNAPDILENRESLTPMAITLNIVLFVLAVFLWVKARKN